MKLTIASAEKPEKGGKQCLWAKEEEPVLILRHSFFSPSPGLWCNLFFSKVVDAEFPMLNVSKMHF